MSAPGRSRRGVLRAVALLGVAGVIVTRPWETFSPPDFDYEDIPDLPPLRRIATDATSAAGLDGQNVFLGLEVSEAPTRQMGPEIGPSTICQLLDLPWAGGTPVPVTYFTDIRCPVCRSLERDLAGIDRTHPGLFALRTREFPVFGPRSEAAARVIRAAAGQGASEIVRRQLHQRPAAYPPEGVISLADTLGLDGAALITAWQSADIAASLDEDRALAQRLGFLGTPGLVIGRTVLPGAVPRASLLHLMQTEAGDAPMTGCP